MLDVKIKNICMSGGIKMANINKLNYNKKNCKCWKTNKKTLNVSN